MTLATMITDFQKGATGVGQGLEGLVENNPHIAAAIAAATLYKTEDHGLLRSTADYYALSQVFQGKAGTITKAYVAYDAAEAAYNAAEGGGVITQVFAAVAAGFAAYKGMNSIEDDVKAKATPAPAATSRLPTPALVGA